MRQRLTRSEYAAWKALSTTAKSAAALKVNIAVLRSLARKGYATMVTPAGKKPPAIMFATFYTFTKIA